MSKVSIIICDFKPIIVSTPIPQTEIFDYMAWLLATAQCSQNNVVTEEEANEIYKKMQSELKRYGVSANYINKRELNALSNVFCHIEKTFLTHNFPEIFENIIEDYQGKDLNSRLIKFEELVFDVMQKWYEQVNIHPDDIIHATCTGYISPSPIQKLLSKNGWEDITVTHSYHMGCYGAIPPLRMAVGFLASNNIFTKQKKQIDILHTEYSSLHFQTKNCSSDQLVSMTLFGDGFIKYSVKISDGSYNDLTGLKVITAQDRIITDSLDEMSLIPGPYGFEMWLSKNVPLKIKEEIQSFIMDMCAQAEIEFDAIKDEVIFALHPGGPKILDHIKEKLQLKDDQIKFSKKILFEHGNMVSATLPYIWKEIIDDATVVCGTKIISIAFGPGITIAGFILEKT